MGRRVSKTIYHWNTSTSDWQLSKTEKYAYDGWNLIASFVASNTLQKSYLWGEDLSGSLQGAGGVSGLLAVKDSSGTYIPTYDGNGNIMAYVDSTGNKVAEFEYDAFGRTIVKAGVKADDMAFRFSSKYLDTETGDYYYGYRYLNPETGRWLGRDPLQERGGENLYGFVQNNAISKLDLLGQDTFAGKKCCCKGRTVDNKPIPTGIKICQGPAITNAKINHVWIEWPGGSAGFTGNSEGFAGTGIGQVSIPESDEYTKEVYGKKSCRDISLSPCNVDFLKLRDAIRTLARMSQQNPPYYFIFGNNCLGWAEGIVTEALNSSTITGCTVF